MLLTKELRSGNKVKTREGEIITVQQILSSSIIYDSQIELNREAVHMPGSSKVDYVVQLSEVIQEIDCHEIFPIALTPEILKGCGFRNFLREEWIISVGNSHIDFVFMEGALRLRCPAPALTSIRHVHELQNLLFAISGFEPEMEC